MTKCRPKNVAAVRLRHASSRRFAVALVALTRVMSLAWTRDAMRARRSFCYRAPTLWKAACFGHLLPIKFLAPLKINTNFISGSISCTFPCKAPMISLNPCKHHRSQTEPRRTALIRTLWVHPSHSLCYQRRQMPFRQGTEGTCIKAEHQKDAEVEKTLALNTATEKDLNIHSRKTI